MNNTREQILHKSFKLFIERGYSGVSMNDLVETTGLSKGAFYHYFSSKEALFSATIDVLFIDSNPFNSGFKPIEKADFLTNLEGYLEAGRQFMKRLMDLVESDAQKANYYELMINAMHFAPGFMQKIETMYQTELMYWTRALELAQQTGEITTDLTASEMARHIQWLHDGIGLNMMMTRQMPRFIDTFEQAVQNYYSLIKRQ